MYIRKTSDKKRKNVHVGIRTQDLGYVDEEGTLRHSLIQITTSNEKLMPSAIGQNIGVHANDLTMHMHLRQGLIDLPMHMHLCQGLIFRVSFNLPWTQINHPRSKNDHLHSKTHTHNCKKKSWVQLLPVGPWQEQHYAPSDSERWQENGNNGTYLESNRHEQSPDRR